MFRSFSRLAAGLLLLVAACHAEFQINKFPTHEELYRASVKEYNRHKWDNAIAGFDKLTLELPARDSLLPRSYWYLASAHEHSGEHLLAAQSFSRLVESFPDDSLAPSAALEAGRAYARLWRRPTLDPTYGETALATFGTLVSLYPSSPQADSGKRETANLEEMFAEKSYGTGMFYLRRRAFDSAIIYFKDVVAKWPTAPHARDARLRLVDAYKAIRYREDASDVCTQLRKQYPNDRDVRQTCAGVPDAKPAAAAAAPTRAASPPSPSRGQ